MNCRDFRDEQCLFEKGNNGCQLEKCGCFVLFVNSDVLDDCNPASNLFLRKSLQKSIGLQLYGVLEETDYMP